MQKTSVGVASAWLALLAIGCEADPMDTGTSEAAINLADCQEQMDAVVEECLEHFDDREPGTCIGVEVCCELSWGPFVTPSSVDSCIEATAVMRAVMAECAGMHCGANFDMEFAETDHALTLDEIEQWVMNQLVGIAADAVVEAIMAAIAAALDLAFPDGDDGDDNDMGAGDGTGSGDDMELPPLEEEDMGAGDGSGLTP